MSNRHPINKEFRRNNWYDRYHLWMDSEPPMWKIFSWRAWHRSKPEKPQWLIDYELRR